MNIEHYQRLLGCFDAALDVFTENERDLIADDASLRRNLLLLRARVVRVELGHPGGLGSVTDQNSGPPASIRQGKSSPTNGIGAEYSRSPITVLIADDDECFRRLARIILDASGEFTVVAEAEDGRQAVQLAMIHVPNVILMDLEMPVCDGARATELIREVLPNVKVVMHTGNPSATSRVRPSAGVASYLPKPARRDRLLEALRKAHRGEDAFVTSGETSRTYAEQATAAVGRGAFHFRPLPAKPQTAG